jgi:hypothetical protein
MSDYSDDDDTPSFAPPPRPAADGAVITPVAPDGSVREETFSVEAPGAVVKVQLVCLKDQLYVWVGAVGADASTHHGEMSMALPGRGTAGPAVAALTGRGDTNASSAADADRASDHLASRLAKRAGVGVVASVNVAADLRPIAERAIAEKLAELGM